MSTLHTGRRAFVLAGAATAGAALFPRVGRADAPAEASTMMDFIAGPEGKAAWSGRDRFFDVHTHVFNASDVPAQAFIAHSFLHLDVPVVTAVMEKLGALGAGLARDYAMRPAEEMRVLAGLADRYRDWPLEQQTADLDAQVRQYKQDLALTLLREFYKHPFLYAVLRRAAGAETKTLGTSAQMEQLVAAGLDGNYVDAEPKQSDSPEKKMRHSLMAGIGFLGNMLSPRHHNLRTFIRKFHKGSPHVPLSGCFAAMVDFNYLLPSPDWVSSMQDQVLLHERLADFSGGFLLPIVGYNPVADYKSKSGDASLVVMEDAVKRHGCVGVKIYPPTGFSPFGNGKIQYTEANGDRGWIGADDMKAILTRFYLKCQDLDIPVMAHTNKSMGRDRASDLLAGPAGWKTLDKTAPDELKSLKVHLGHFGGAAPHGKHGKEDWTKEFAALMNDATHVEPYGDVAFWNKLPGHAAPVSKLDEVLKMPLKDGRTVTSRTMYGSDWHMLSMVKDWDSYPERVRQVLRRLHVSDEDIAGIFGGNGLACYGLTAASNSKNWRRLVEHYSATNGRHLPGWIPPMTSA